MTSTNQENLNVMLSLFYKENPTKEDYTHATTLWHQLRSIPLSVSLTMGAMLEELHAKIA